MERGTVRGRGRACRQRLVRAGRAYLPPSSQNPRQPWCVPAESARCSGRAPGGLRRIIRGDERPAEPTIQPPASRGGPRSPSSIKICCAQTPLRALGEPMRSTRSNSPLWSQARGGRTLRRGLARGTTLHLLPLQSGLECRYGSSQAGLDSSLVSQPARARPDPAESRRSAGHPASWLSSAAVLKAPEVARLLDGIPSGGGSGSA